jgi:hypothetical protein
MSRKNAAAAPQGAFWPDGARLVVSLSLQMEAGAQPENDFGERSRSSRGQAGAYVRAGGLH